MKRNSSATLWSKASRAWGIAEMSGRGRSIAEHHVAVGGEVVDVRRPCGGERVADEVMETRRGGRGRRMIGPSGSSNSEAALMNGQPRKPGSKSWAVMLLTRST